MQPRHNIAFIISMFTILLTFFTIATFWYFYLTEQSPLWYPNEPFPLNQNSIVQGESFTFVFERCSTGTFNYSFGKRYIRLDQEQPDVYVSGGIASTQGEGCQEIQSTENYVPKDLPPGQYRMLFDIEVHGRLKTHNFVVRTRDFQVIPK